MVADLTKHEDTTPAKLDAAWGDMDDITPEDVRLSKIRLMQPGSDAVESGGARPGEYRDGTTNDLLGSDEAPLEVVIIHRYLTWTVSDIVDGKKKYRQTLPVTNENRHWSYYNDDRTESRAKTFNFYCCLPSNMHKLPKIISMRNMASDCGQALQTYLLELRSEGRPPAAVVVRLKSERKENDNGKFWVPSFSYSRDTTAEELAQATKWRKFVNELEESNSFRSGTMFNEQEEAVEAAPAERGTPLEDDDVPF